MEKQDKETKIKKTMRRFAEKMFEFHPEMMGLNICGTALKKRGDGLGDLRVSGVYIENKNFRDAESKK